jgi:hypothetical protein
MNYWGAPQINLLEVEEKSPTVILLSVELSFEAFACAHDNGMCSTYTSKTI